MSPEYAIDGLFSVKSDVFSFGVLVLEIVSGRKNRGFRHAEHKLNLLGHVSVMPVLFFMFKLLKCFSNIQTELRRYLNVVQAWMLHKEGRPLDLIDESIVDTCIISEVLRSIEVALLCVQKSPEDRPKMSNVVLMLSCDIVLPQPREPGFFTERDLSNDSSSTIKHEISSVNELTSTLLEAR